MACCNAAILHTEHLGQCPADTCILSGSFICRNSISCIRCGCLLHIKKELLLFLLTSHTVAITFLYLLDAVWTSIHLYNTILISNQQWETSTTFNYSTPLIQFCYFPVLFITFPLHLKKQTVCPWIKFHKAISQNIPLQPILLFNFLADFDWNCINSTLMIL